MADLCVYAALDDTASFLELVTKTAREGRRGPGGGPGEGPQPGEALGGANLEKEMAIGNTMEGGAWQASVHEIAKMDTS